MLGTLEVQVAFRIDSRCEGLLEIMTVVIMMIGIWIPLLKTFHFDA